MTKQATSGILGPDGRPLPAAAPSTAGLPAVVRSAATAVTVGPEVSLTNSQEIDAFLRSGGGSASGAVVTSETAMRVAAVYGCVNIIANAIASLSLELKRRRNGKVEDASEIEPELADLLDTQPNNFQSAFEFRRLLQTHILLKGNAYAQIIRSPTTKRITDLVPLNPDAVEPKKRRDGEIVYHLYSDSRSYRTLPADEVFHLRGHSLDGVVGRSVIQAARESIGTALAGEAHNASFFGKGARPSGVLQTKEALSEQAFERLTASLDEHEGIENARKTMILEEGLEFKPVTMSAADAQFIESRGFTRSEICMFFNVPPHMLGDTEKQSSWGAGIEQLDLGFVRYTMGPWFRLWEGALLRDVIRPRRQAARVSGRLFARFDQESLSLADVKSLGEFMQKMLAYSVFNPDEVRARLGYGPRVDGRGHEYLQPPNTAGGASPRPNDQ